MQALFVIIASLGLVYFLFVKRRFDFFLIAYLSAVIYFLPGFVGYVIYPGSILYSEQVDLIPEAYTVMSLVLAAILCTAIISDFSLELAPPRTRIVGAQRTSTIALVLSFIGALGAVLTSGPTLLSPEKFEMLPELNRWYVLAASALPIAAVTAFERKQWIKLSIAGVLLALDLFVGFRITAAITTIAIFALSLSRYKIKFRLIFHDKWKVLAVCIVVPFFFVVKGFMYPIKVGDWDFISVVWWDPDFYASTLINSEPFYTQAILNEVLHQRLEVGLDHFSSLLYLLVPFATEFTNDVLSFNDLFQPTLFPTSVSWMGMANNIWAEALSSGGYAMLVLFLFVFLFLLILGSSLLRSTDPEIRAGAAVLFSWLAFYVHRNDVLYQAILERRAILLWLLCVLASILVDTLFRRIRSRSEKS